MRIRSEMAFYTDFEWISLHSFLDHETMFSHFRRQTTPTATYTITFTRALEKKDSWSQSCLTCDAKTLNDALEKHLQLIGAVFLFLRLPAAN
jgi:hypothetical protein